MNHFNTRFALRLIGLDDAGNDEECLLFYQTSLPFQPCPLLLQLQVGRRDWSIPTRPLRAGPDFRTVREQTPKATKPYFRGYMYLVIEADCLKYDADSEVWLAHDTHYLWSDENLHDAAEELITVFGFQRTASIWPEDFSLEEVSPPFKTRISLRIYGEDEAGNWDDCILFREIDVPPLPYGSVFQLNPTRGPDTSATAKKRAFPEKLTLSSEQFYLAYELTKNELTINCELVIKPFEAFVANSRELVKFFGFRGTRTFLKELD